MLWAFFGIGCGVFFIVISIENKRGGLEQMTHYNTAISRETYTIPSRGSNLETRKDRFKLVFIYGFISCNDEEREVKLVIFSNAPVYLLLDNAFSSG